MPHETSSLSSTLNGSTNDPFQPRGLSTIHRVSDTLDAINAIFPRTEVQLCVIHQIRNSLKYVASKNQKEFMADLKPVYKAETVEGAETALEALEEKWGEYPIFCV